MLTAINQSHQVIIATAADRQTPYYCPGCRTKVILRRGQRVVAHFAHQSGSHCAVSSEPESQQHLTGKWQMAHYFGEDKVELEPYLKTIKQRPDLIVTQAKRQVPVEFQCSAISPEKLTSRNTGYQQLALKPVWVLGNQYYQHMTRQAQVAPFVTWSAAWGWYLLFWRTATSTMELWCQIQTDLLGTIGYQRYRLLGAGQYEFLENKAIRATTWQVNQLRLQIIHGLRYRTPKYMQWQNFCYSHHRLLQTIPDFCFDQPVVAPIFGDSVAIFRYCLLILISELGSDQELNQSQLFCMVEKLRPMLAIGNLANCSERRFRDQLRLVIDDWVQTLMNNGYLHRVGPRKWRVTRQIMPA